MTNYSYLGKPSYSYIVIPVTIFLLLGFGSLIWLFQSFALHHSVKEELALAQENKRNANRIILGTKIGVAEEGVDRYIKNVAGIGADKFLFGPVRDEGLFPRETVDLIKVMVAAGKTKEDAVALLKRSETEGLNAELQREERLIKLLSEFISGSPNEEELKNILSVVRPMVPAIVASHLDGTFTFDIPTGGTGILEGLKGEIANLRSVIDDQDQAMEGLLDNVKKHHAASIQTYKELKAQYMDDDQALENLRWQQRAKQGNEWENYHRKTLAFIDKTHVQSDEILHFLNEIQKLEALVEVKRQRVSDYVPPVDAVDGELLSVNSNLGVAVIDIGRKDGLKAGQGFDVFQYKGGVRGRLKGRLTVRDVNQYVSVCKIEKEEELNPLLPGDRVSDGRLDQAYDRKIAIKYTLVGLFLSDPSERLAKGMVIASGGELVDSLAKRTDYVVFGELVNSAELELVNQLGLKVVRGVDLGEHLGLSPELIQQIDEYAWKQAK